MKIHAILLGVLLCATCSELSAQSSGPWEVSPFAGYFFGGTVFSGREPLESNVFQGNLVDHASYGLRAGYAFRSGLEPELEWSRIGTNLEYRNFFRPGKYPVTMNFFLAGLTDNLTSGRIRPYVGMAVGAATVSNAFETQRRFTGKIALGVKAFAASRIALRLEAAGYATRLGDSNFGVTCTTFTPDGHPMPCSKPWLLGGNLGAGLVLSF